MKRMISGRIAFGAMLSILVAAGTTECFAGHWGGGSYGSSGGSSGLTVVRVGSYGSYGSYGGSSGHFRTPVRSYLRAVANRIRSHHSSGGSSGVVAVRKVHYGSHGSSGGSSGMYRSYYRSSSSGGSSGMTRHYYRRTSGGSSGGSSGTAVQVMPTVISSATQPSPVITTPVATPVLENKSVLSNGFLTVSVPADAKVYVNDKLTKTPGSLRRYKTPAIAADEALSYEIRAVVNVNGKEVEQTKVVDLTAGGSKQLDFEFEISPPPVTVLSLTVPENSTVKLAGNPTQAEGKLRLFTTTSLAKGETWQDYTILVSSVVNGQKVVRSKKIDLKAGDNVDLAFDFTNETNKVALR